MEKIFVSGGNKLKGKVRIDSAKNSVLPIIASSILTSDTIVIKNAPMLNDVQVICELLKSLGCNINIDKVKGEISIDSSKVQEIEPSGELVRRMRASFLVMGPMVARFGKFKISLPGGCNIGTRPIDLHLKGLKALGAEISTEGGIVEVKCKKLKGNKIYLDFPSVGATENIMMAATTAKGVTVLENVAEEPEIEDLANFLNKMGAKIYGAGTDTIIIEGVERLKGVEYVPIFDRIEAGTFMIAAAITKSKIILENAREYYMKPLVAKLREMGIEITSIEDNVMKVNGDVDVRPVDIKTLPHPGFPTDMQSQMMALLATVKGTSVITETIFENRFMHVSELNRLGCKIKIEGRSAIIEGVEQLSGCEVKATDLRAGAALIIAGLVAKGETIVDDIYHIDRGYVKIEEKFKKLGAKVYRREI